MTRRENTPCADALGDLVELLPTRKQDEARELECCVAEAEQDREALRKGLQAALAALRCCGDPGAADAEFAARAVLIDCCRVGRGSPMLWYLSFAEPKPPNGKGWLGACIVRGNGLIDAVRRAWMVGCNPGGEVVGGTIKEPSETVANPVWHDRLLDEAQVKRIFGGTKRVKTSEASGILTGTPTLPANDHSPAQGYTERQLDNWRAFERVRKGGKWNMLDPKARRASGLDEDEYQFCISNYSALKAVATAGAVKEGA